VGETPGRRPSPLAPTSFLNHFSCLLVFFIPLNSGSSHGSVRNRRQDTGLISKRFRLRSHFPKARYSFYCRFEMG
jgi:hypothetical protein